VVARTHALQQSQSYFDRGVFQRDLARRVAIRTESPDPARRPELYRYLTDELGSALTAMGFECAVHENPVDRGGPLLVARRHEADDLPTVMSYGHADVVSGYDDEWRDGLEPWELVAEGDRWYGRGTADNKGQHTINLAALRSVLEQRGRLGFNAVFLFETSEETGSPGLREFCEANADLFAADVFIASDGPRIQPDVPTIFMGSRGAFNFTMRLTLRDGAHHSGNWGGLLSNPGVIMAHALASMISASGELLVDGWKAAPMPDSVRAAIGRLTAGGSGADGDGGPAIDPDWGEPGCTPEERVFGTNTFEVLAFETGNPRNPVNAIPPSAVAHCHLRFVAGTQAADLLPALRAHLDDAGFEQIELEPGDVVMHATRLDPNHPWAQWAIESVARSSGKEVAVLPNLGGSLPNDVFADVLGLPTIWVPHSYAGCSQHAPDEHVLAPVCEEALKIMSALWWDLGEPGTPVSDRAS
jgi:acetylornithine deacetylase/succinyl-diaminopimelate desuccinylase-like protein